MAESALIEFALTSAKKGSEKGFEKFKNLFSYKSEVEKYEKLVDAAYRDLMSGSNLDEHAMEELSYQGVRLRDLSDVIASRELRKPTFFFLSNPLARFQEAREFYDIMKNLKAAAIDHSMIRGMLPRTQAIRVNNQSQRADSSLSSSNNTILTDYFVGRDNDRDKIVRIIRSDAESSGTLSVSSIFGIGGMGKTALAFYVFNDDMMKRCFDARFWVGITPQDDFDVRKVLLQIIEEYTKGESLPHNLSNNTSQLYNLFQRAISGKKILVVLDNFNDHDGHLRHKWVGLERMLSKHAAAGSCVLITTRNKGVAESMSTTKPYELRDLTEEDSWDLLQKIALTQWQEPGVEVIGMEIVKQIPKVPLVIRSIAGHLSMKGTVLEWNAFKDDLLANFSSCCGDEVMDMLKFSYHQLDETLKLCATYCSLFEKGGVFSQYLMIKRWIALGYVKPTNDKQSLEEAGWICMMKLVNFGFLQSNDYLLFPFPSDTNNNFMVHDVMYELLSAVAGSMYKVIDSKTVTVDKRVLHLSLWKAIRMSSKNSGYWEVPPSVFKIEHLHSLIRGNAHDAPFWLVKKLTVSNLSMCDKFKSNLKYLKVLDLSGMGMKELPAFVSDLRCLGFLNLSNNEIVKLPNSITRLVNLQSLYLCYCDNLKELPKDMSNLKKLRHLLLKGSEKLSHMPMGLGELTDLRTLNTFIVGNLIDSKATKIMGRLVGNLIDSKATKKMGRLADLNQLNKLSGRLTIEVHRESKYITSSETISAANLKDKENLSHLRIIFNNGTKDDERVLGCLPPPPKLNDYSIEGYGGERLPSWMKNHLDSYLPSLRVIEIIDCKSCKGYLCSGLGRLPHLETLTLSWLDEVEYVEDITSHNNECEVSQAPLFPSLQELTVKKMPKLKGWWKSELDSSEEDPQIQAQRQQLINWNPAFPKLSLLTVDDLELSITITKQQIGGFTSLTQLLIIDNNATEQQALTLPRSSCFPNLKELCYRYGRLEVLPEGIRHLSSLQCLLIYDMVNIKAIPEWIDSLTSLQLLHLKSCRRLESLPHQIANLPNLKSIVIEDCPMVQKKCWRPDGEYWKFIQNIPDISIR